MTFGLKLLQAAKKSPLFQLYKRKYLPKKNSVVITFDGLRKFLQDYLFEDFKPLFLPNLDDGIKIEDIEQFLVHFDSSS